MEFEKLLEALKIIEGEVAKTSRASANLMVFVSGTYKYNPCDQARSRSSLMIEDRPSKAVAALVEAGFDVIVSAASCDLREPPLGASGRGFAASAPPPPPSPPTMNSTRNLPFSGSSTTRRTNRATTSNGSFFPTIS